MVNLLNLLLSLSVPCYKLQDQTLDLAAGTFEGFMCLFNYMGHRFTEIPDYGELEA